MINFAGAGVQPNDFLVIIASTPEKCITAEQVPLLLAAQKVHKTAAKHAGPSTSSNDSHPRNSAQRDSPSADEEEQLNHASQEALKRKRAKKRQYKEIDEEEEEEEEEYTRNAAEDQAERDRERVNEEMSQIEKEKEAQEERLRQHRVDDERRKRKIGAKEVRQQVEREKRQEDEKQAAREEIVRKQERRRNLDRQRNAEETLVETPSNVRAGEKKLKASASISNLAAVSTHSIPSRQPPPKFDLASLGPGKPNWRLKKLLDDDAANQQHITARAGFQKSSAKEVVMHTGFKSARQALEDGTVPASSQPGSAEPSSPSLTVHQVPVTRPGGNKRMNMKGQFWKKASEAKGQGEEQGMFVEGSSTGQRRRR